MGPADSGGGCHACIRHGASGFIGRRLAALARAAYFGWLATLADTDAPASSAATWSLLAWEPGQPGLLDDLAHGEFFQGAQR